jgi:hypothetical protein
MTGLTLGGVIEHPELSLIAAPRWKKPPGGRSDWPKAGPGCAMTVFDKIMRSDARCNRASVHADLAAGRGFGGLYLRHSHTAAMIKGKRSAQAQSRRSD